MNTSSMKQRRHRSFRTLDILVGLVYVVSALAMVSISSSFVGNGEQIFWAILCAGLFLYGVAQLGKDVIKRGHGTIVEQIIRHRGECGTTGAIALAAGILRLIANAILSDSLFTNAWWITVFDLTLMLVGGCMIAYAVWPPESAKERAARQARQHEFVDNYTRVHSESGESLKRPSRLPKAEWDTDPPMLI